MRLIGLLPVRNEDWVLGLSARAALMWCDALIVLLHACTDRSEFIVYDLQEQFPGRLKFLVDDGAVWDEMNHRQSMLDAARSFGATHLAIIDADEVLSGGLLPSIRTHIESMAPGRILQLPGYNLRGGLDKYHATGIWADRWFSTAFHDDPRLSWSGDQFHHREPGGALMQQARPIMQGQGGIMHLWGASERRLVAKHALYKMTETLRWPNKSRAEIDRLYSLAFNPSANLQFDQNWRYADIPRAWWEPYVHLLDRVRVLDVPWQEEECRRLYAEHGHERFASLDLFGVIEPATVTR